jgi:diguanylate cyclase (GGDEF)-like protein/PAS domain S-box-containing protein
MTGDEAIRVLLIEDNDGDANLVETYLKRAKTARFALERVDRLELGLDCAREGDFDVLLLDLTLPDSQGQETFERALAELHRIPIIVMTGIDDTKLAVEAVRDGAQDYLVKRQVDTQLLVRSIRYAIERKKAEERVRESEERYALAVDGANDGVWDWDLEQDRIYYSPRWKSMLGYSEDDIGSAPSDWFDRVHADDLDHLRKDITAHLDGRTAHLENEHRIRHSDGGYRWVLSRGIAVPPEDGSPRRIAGSLTDIQVRKITEQQLLHDAMHDALTGLPNWALFMDRLGISIAQSKRRESHMFAVLFLDLDRFKNVNDSLGHTMGDKLLIAIAGPLRTLLRPGDTVARLGGDEFAVLVSAIEAPSDATRIAERIHEEVGRPFDLDGHEVFTTASIGIALGSNGYDRPEEVLRDADTAMYRAKSLGKARHAIFDQAMHERAVELLRLETDLRRAVERQEFVVHYQPIISLSHGGIEGFEALIRWQHPTRGLVPPGEFLVVAEETGLIVPIGWWVLETACKQMASWHRRFESIRPLSINVNLSSRQFLQADLIEKFREILVHSRLNPSSLRVEITESMIMDDTHAGVSRLQQLRDLGIELHLDDFGTGYSSLSQLHRLPTNTIKIDRSFVSRMSESVGHTEIVATIVALARSLDMNAAAEGLETAEQLSKLRSLDCDSGQGFFFSRPLDDRAASELIASGRSW